MGTARDSSDIDSIYIQEHFLKFSAFCNFIPFDIDKKSNAPGLYFNLSAILIYNQFADSACLNALNTIPFAAKGSKTGV